MPRVQRRLAGLVDEYILDYFERQDEFKDIVPLLKEKFKLNRKFKVRGTLEEAIHQYNERASSLVQTTASKLSEFDTKFLFSNKYAAIPASAEAVDESSRAGSKVAAGLGDSHDDSFSSISSEKETTAIKPSAVRATRKASVVASSKITSKFQTTASKTTSKGTGSTADKNNSNEPEKSSSISSSSDEKATLRLSSVTVPVKSSAKSKISVKALKLALATTKAASTRLNNMSLKQIAESDSSLSDSAVDFPYPNRAASGKASDSESDTDETSNSVGKAQGLSSQKKGGDADAKAASKSKAAVNATAASEVAAASKTTASKRSIAASKAMLTAKNTAKSSSSELSDDDEALVCNKLVKHAAKRQAVNLNKPLRKVSQTASKYVSTILILANSALKHSSYDGDDDIETSNGQVSGISNSFTASPAKFSAEPKFSIKYDSESSKVDLSNLESAGVVGSRRYMAVASDTPEKSTFSSADIFSKLTPQGPSWAPAAPFQKTKVSFASQHGFENSENILGGNDVKDENSSDTKPVSKPNSSKLVSFVSSKRSSQFKYTITQRDKMQSSDDGGSSMASKSSGEVCKAGIDDFTSSEGGKSSGVAVEKSSLLFEGTSMIDHEKIPQNSLIWQVQKVKDQSLDDENNLGKRGDKQYSLTSWKASLCGNENSDSEDDAEFSNQSDGLPEEFGKERCLRMKKSAHKPLL